MYKQVQYSMANTLRRMCICYSDSADAVSDNVAADVLSDDTELYDVDEMDDVDDVYDDVEPSSSATELYSCSSDDDDVDQPPTKLTRQRLDNQVRPVHLRHTVIMGHVGSTPTTAANLGNTCVL